VLVHNSTYWKIKFILIESLLARLLVIQDHRKEDARSLCYAVKCIKVHSALKYSNKGDRTLFKGLAMERALMTWNIFSNKVQE